MSLYDKLNKLLSASALKVGVEDLSERHLDVLTDLLHINDRSGRKHIDVITAFKGKSCSLSDSFVRDLFEWGYLECDDLSKPIEEQNQFSFSDVCNDCIEQIIVAAVNKKRLLDEEQLTNSLIGKFTDSARRVSDAEEVKNKQ